MILFECVQLILCKLSLEQSPPKECVRLTLCKLSPQRQIMDIARDELLIMFANNCMYIIAVMIFIHKEIHSSGNF